MILGTIMKCQCCQSYWFKRVYIFLLKMSDLQVLFCHLVRDKLEYVQQKSCFVYSVAHKFSDTFDMTFVNKSSISKFANSVCPSFCLSVCLFERLSVFLSVSVFCQFSVWTFVHLSLKFANSVCPSFCLSICLFKSLYARITLGVWQDGCKNFRLT